MNLNLPDITVSKCNGDCCRRFLLADGKTPVPLLKEVFDRHPLKPPCVDRVFDMIIPIPSRPDDDPTLQYFTCKYLDAFTGKCTDYDNRPQMCRAYPYGRKCEHCGQAGYEGLNPPSTSWYKEVKERLVQIAKATSSKVSDLRSGDRED